MGFAPNAGWKFVALGDQGQYQQFSGCFPLISALGVKHISFLLVSDSSRATGDQFIDVLARIRDDVSTKPGEGVISITIGYDIHTYNDPNTDEAKGETRARFLTMLQLSAKTRNRLSSLAVSYE